MLSTVKYKSAKIFLASSTLGVGFLLMSMIPVEAAGFNWSFSNNVGGIDGTVLGTLTLEAPEGENISATSVILTSTTNPLFDSLIGVNFVDLPNFSNGFDVNEGRITAAYFGTDFFSNNINLQLQLNRSLGAVVAENLGVITVAGDPFNVCPENCLQTAPIFEDNEGQTQFAPTFTPIPEPSTILSLLTIGGIALGASKKKHG